MLLLMTFAALLHPPLDRCSALIGSCEYYSCVEEERLSCGETGYPLAYGVKYCEKLSALEFSPARTAINQKVFPADGNAWRDSVRSCLQEEMDHYFATEKRDAISCQSLRDFAFGSHPRCYTQNISFCDLTPESVLKVGLTIGPSDLFTAESLNQVQETAEICSAQLGDKLKTETNFLVRLQLYKYRAIWDSISANPETVQEEIGLN